MWIRVLLVKRAVELFPPDKAHLYRNEKMLIMEGSSEGCPRRLIPTHQTLPSGKHFDDYYEVDYPGTYRAIISITRSVCIFPMQAFFDRIRNHELQRFFFGQVLSSVCTCFVIMKEQQNKQYFNFSYKFSQKNLNQNPQQEHHFRCTFYAGEH